MFTTNDRRIWMHCSSRRSGKGSNSQSPWILVQAGGVRLTASTWNFLQKPRPSVASHEHPNQATTDRHPTPRPRQPPRRALGRNQQNLAGRKTKKGSMHASVPFRPRLLGTDDEAVAEQQPLAAARRRAAALLVCRQLPQETKQRNTWKGVERGEGGQG